MRSEHILTHADSAGFADRLLAALIDAAIILVPGFIFSMLLPGRVVDAVVWLTLGGAYAIYFWTSSGQTIGKMLMGLKVVHAQSGELLDPGAAVLRYAGYLVSAVPLLLGFLWVLFDRNGQGWHDKIANTRVIKAR